MNFSKNLVNRLIEVSFISHFSRGTTFLLTTKFVEPLKHDKSWEYMQKCPFFQNRVIFWKIPNYDRNILAMPKCSSAKMIRFRGGDFDLELSMYPCKSCNFWKNAFLSIFTTFEFFWPIFSSPFDPRTLRMPSGNNDGHFGILCVGITKK